MKKTVLFALLAASIQTLAQQNDLCRLRENWNTSFGGQNLKETASAMALATDGSAVLVGSQYPKKQNSQGTDAWIARVSAEGKILWEKSIGGSQFDNLLAVDIAPDGNIIAVGHSYSTDEDLDGMKLPKAPTHAWLIKISGDGQILWQKFVSNVAEPFSLKTTTDGSIVLAGINQASRNQDVWVGKLNTEGRTLWSRNIGGSEKESAPQLDVNNAGDIALMFTSASQNGDLTMSKGKTDICVFKLGANGATLQQNRLGGSNDEQGNSIKFTSDNQLFISGRTFSKDGDIVAKMSNTTNGKGWFLKIDSNGKIRKQTYLPGSPFMAIPHSDGGAWVLNRIHYGLNSAMFNNYDKPEAHNMTCLQKISESGRLEWSRLIDSHNHLNVATAIEYNTKDNAMMVAGNILPSSQDSRPDYWLSSFSYVTPDVAPRLSVFDENDQDVSGTKIDFNKRDNYTLKAAVNLSVGDKPAYAWMRENMIVKAYDSQNQQNTFEESGTFQAIVTHKGCTLFSDVFETVLDKKVTSNIPEIVVANVTEPAKAVVSEIPKLSEEDKSLGVQVFPNPVRDVVYVRPLSTNYQQYSLQIVRENGQSVGRAEHLSKEGIIEVSLEKQPNGVYFFQVIGENQQIVTRKVIKSE
jgi:hypothetical protein